MTKNFYEQHNNMYVYFFKQLKNLLDDINYSVYLRGSANKPLDSIEFKPWDIDLVLFSEQDVDPIIISKIRHVTFYFNDYILSDGYPYIDLCIFLNPSDNYSDKYLLYLLKKDACLIEGIGTHRIKHASKPTEQELKALYNKGLVSVINKRYRLSLLKKEDKNISQRLKNIIKSIARCGCVILLLREGVFTRDVNIGLDVLHKYLMNDVFLKIKLPLNSLDYSSDIDLAISKMLENNMD